MTRLAALLVVSSLAGCIGGSKAPGYVAGGTIAAIGAGLLLSTQRSDCSSMPGFDGVGCAAEDVTLGAYGLIAISAGLATMLLTSVIPTPAVGLEGSWTEPAPAPPPVAIPVASETAPPPVEPSDPAVRRLTQLANVYASAGQCSSVDVLAKRVDEIDPAFRATGFLADPRVAACLE